MKLEKIIEKACNDMSEKGYTSSKLIKIIKDNFNSVSEDYDFCQFALTAIMLLKKRITMNPKSMSKLKKQ